MIVNETTTSRSIVDMIDHERRHLAVDQGAARAWKAAWALARVVRRIAAAAAKDGVTTLAYPCRLISGAGTGWDGRHGCHLSVCVELRPPPGPGEHEIRGRAVVRVHPALGGLRRPLTGYRPVAVGMDADPRYLFDPAWRDGMVNAPAVYRGIVKAYARALEDWKRKLAGKEA